MSFFTELKRRNVFRVAAAYAVAGWLVTEIASVVLPTFGAPEWVLKVLIALLLIGFPIAAVFAWVYEITPDGIKREADVDRAQSITPHTAKRLDLITIGLIVVGIGFLLLDRFVWEQPTPAAPPTTAGAPERMDPESDAGGKSIAVLPFSNLSNNPETDAFVAGLHDDLLTQLSKIGDLRVIARTSVLAYQGTTRKVSEIGRELGVEHIMEGGVQRAGNRMRLNVQLIDADTDEHLWAETYDRELSTDNIFDIQSEITREIVDKLEGALSTGESAVLESRPTESLAAYEAFLDAGLLLERSGYGDRNYYGDAIAAAQRAIELDPKFADAWGILGMIQLNVFWYLGRDPEMAEAAKRSIDRALSIDANSVEASIAAAWYPYWVHFDYGTAIPQFERALELSPGSYSAWDGLASVYRRSGQFDRAIKAFHRALDLIPNLQFEYVEIAGTHRALRRFEAADAIIARGLARMPGDPALQFEQALTDAWRNGNYGPVTDAARVVIEGSAGSDSNRFEYVWCEGLFGDPDQAFAYLEEWSPGTIDVQYQYWPETLLEALLLHVSGKSQTGQLQEALAQIERVRTEEPDNVEVEKARGYALALLARPDEAVASAQRVRELYPMSLDAFGGQEYFDAAIAIASLAGKTDVALAWLEEYLTHDAHRTLVAIAADPTFRNITSTARFRALQELHR